jgi:hypothetical protein
MRRALAPLLLAAAAAAALFATPAAAQEGEEEGQTYLLSLALPLGPGDRSDGFRVATWGVDMLAICRIPPGWRIRAGRSANPEGVIEGEATHGVTWIADTARLEGLALVRLHGPVQARDRREGDALHPATFKCDVRLITAAGKGRKRAIGADEVRLAPAAACPAPRD